MKVNHLLKLFIPTFSAFLLASIGQIVDANQDGAQEYSGMYAPDIIGSKMAEDFGAAFLVPKKRFVASYPSIHKSTNMAGVSFAVTRARMQDPTYQTLMSRDYFDFLVEHLSTTSNYIPSGNEKVFRVYNMRLRQTVIKLKEIANTRPSWSKDKRLSETVAVLVYSSISFSRTAAPVQTKIRRGFIASTFWSIYRYIPNIIIYVASDKDKLHLQEMQLPTYQVIQLDNVPRTEQNKTILLPRMSLEDLIGKLKTDSGGMWSKFNYVYFTEGDQILHMRHPKGLYDTMDNSGGTYIAVPHRMQTLPLAITLKKPELRSVFNKPSDGFLNMKNITIATEPLEEAQGSCCDNGRLIVDPCGPRWYQCPEWGLKDISPWLQYGESGFTFGQATAHTGACKYSPQRQLCPMREGCEYRIPPKNSVKDLCLELPNKMRIGPHHKPPPQ